METPLKSLLRRIREALNDPATKGQPDTVIEINFTRGEWKEIRNDLALFTNATTYSGLVEAARKSAGL